MSPHNTGDQPSTAVGLEKVKHERGEAGGQILSAYRGRLAESRLINPIDQSEGRCDRSSTTCDETHYVALEFEVNVQRYTYRYSCT
jgi:hypothetical protein